MKILLTTFTHVIICFLFFPSNRVIAQVANYVFTETTGTYQAIHINTGTDNIEGKGANTNINLANDNARLVDALRLPFPFCMGGVSFPQGSSIHMHHNGYIVLNSNVQTTWTPGSTLRYQPLTNFNNSISAFGADLMTGSSTSYGVRVFGTSPNRVIVFQWGTYEVGVTGFKRVTNGHNFDKLHFQIRLYETNVIEFHYLIVEGNNNNGGSISTDIQVGLRGGGASDFNVRTKTGNTVWNNNSSQGSALTNTMNFNNRRGQSPSQLIKPNGSVITTGTSSNPGTGTGLIFRWTPPVSGTWNNPASWVNCYNPLAVTLDKLTGLAEQRSNKVEWETASEINNDYFIVETSANGIDWNELDRVNGMGTTTKRNSYELYHQNPEDVQYYRLKQMDFDGTRTNYGPIVIERKTLPVTLIRKTNLLGQDVDENYRGVILFHYSDGTTVKIYR